jgi:hypothetical protein
MPGPIYVPAPAGQEAVVLSAHSDKNARRPVSGSIDIIRCPVVAWRLEATDMDAPRGAVETVAHPVLPFEPTDWVGSVHEVLISLSDGRLYRPDDPISFESLAEALLAFLDHAQVAWDATHKPEAA